MAAAITGAALLVLIVFIFNMTLPNVQELREINLEESTIIYDREGNQLYAIHGEENRELVDLQDISPHLIQATLAIEDRKFYNHLGFDPKGLVRAVLNNLQGKPAQGASTITQQFIKNSFLTPEKTYSRKIKELILAVKLEANFSKDEILEMYLNEIPYGNNAYGAQLAAKTYFDKEAKDLTLGESAILASLPKAPTRYSPYGNYKHPQLLKDFTEEELKKRPIKSEADLKWEDFARGLLGAEIELGEGNSIYIRGRTDLVLQSMVETGAITADEKEEALDEIAEIEFKPYRENIIAPHFVFYVKGLMEEEYGKEVVERGGLKIYTTIDPTLQQIAEEVIAEKIERNVTNFDAHNASFVAINPETGQILAMVGSADYFDEEIDGNVNIATSLRQPGSSFKPFIYALAFYNGIAPGTVIYDVPTRFGKDRPNNYDGKFIGPITVRQALGESRNIPAAKTYFLSGREENIIPFVEELGIGTLNHEGNYGWPLALGSGEVRLLDLVSAYGAFATGGLHTDSSPILRVENAAGEVLEQWDDNKFKLREVIDKQVAYLITSILSDDKYMAGPTYLRISGHQVAAKTGTSNKKLPNGNILPNNLLTIGYTPDLVAGAWAGNADGSPAHWSASGYSAAAPIWHDFMERALEDRPSLTFTKPEKIKSLQISKASGKVPSQHTPDGEIITEEFASFSVPTEVDNAFQKFLIDKITNQLATEFCPEDQVIEKSFRVHESNFASTYPTWDADIKAWAEGLEPDTENPFAFGIPPTETCELHTEYADPAENPTIRITQPSSFAQVDSNRLRVVTQVDAPRGISKVEFFRDGDLHYTETQAPWVGSVRINKSAPAGTTFKITAKITDELGYTAESTIEIRVK